MSQWSSFWKNLFGGKKKEPPVITSPYQTPEGQKYQQTIEERLAGRGVGFSPEMVSSTTAPYAIARRATLQNYELPLISAQASKRGLGRSTVAVNEARLSGQEAERDIEQRVADMIYKNELQKRAEINNALAATGQIAGAKADVENTRTATNYATQLENEKSQLAGIGRMGTIGGAIIGGALGAAGGPAGILAGASLGASLGSKISGADDATLLDLLGYAKGTVNIAGGNSNAYTQARLLSQLKGIR